MVDKGLKPKTSLSFLSISWTCTSLFQVSFFTAFCGSWSHILYIRIWFGLAGHYAWKTACVPHPKGGVRAAITSRKSQSNVTTAGELRQLYTCTHSLRACRDASCRQSLIPLSQTQTSASADKDNSSATMWLHSPPSTGISGVYLVHHAVASISTDKCSISPAAM